MAQVEGDFEKGEADGSIDALAVIGAAARAVMPQEFTGVAMPFAVPLTTT